MDIQRSILIVALAVVSYLLVLQWNKDYGQPEAARRQRFDEHHARPAGHSVRLGHQQ